MSSLPTRSFTRRVAFSAHNRSFRVHARGLVRNFSSTSSHALQRNSQGIEFSNAEKQARQKFEQKFYMLKQDELPAAAFGVLREAARTRKTDVSLVEGALAYLETLAANGTLPPQYSVDEKVLQDKYRYLLIFSVASPIKSLRYIPVKEDLLMSKSKSYASLTGYVGPIESEFFGEMTMTKDPASVPSGCVAVEFRFNEVMVTLYGCTIVSKKRDTKPKTYTFFAAEDSKGGGGALAARSSTGGLTLLFDSEMLPRIRPNVDYLAIEL